MRGERARNTNRDHIALAAVPRGTRRKRAVLTRSTRLISRDNSASGTPFNATYVQRFPPASHSASVPGMSAEMAERLEAARPETLDQAARISGITPAALSALYVRRRVERHDRAAFGSAAVMFHVKHSNRLSVRRVFDGSDGHSEPHRSVYVEFPLETARFRIRRNCPI